MIVEMTNELNYSEITKKLEEIFTSEQYDLPVLYDAIRCINVQAQEIEVLKSMLKTLEENYDNIEASLKEEQCQSKDWADRAAYYLGQYEKVSEQHERLIDTIRKIEYDVADRIITKAIQDISKVITTHIEGDHNLVEAEVDIVHILNNIKNTYRRVQDEALD